jgi:hypothetical protein
VGGLLVGAAGFTLDAVLAAVKSMREAKGAGFDLGAALWRLAHPATIADWLEVGGVAAFAIIGGLFVAALTAARRGAGRALAEERADQAGGREA